MNWGDAPGWAALVVALIAVEISRRARKDGQRSADAADRSATAAEQTLADQRQEAQERRDAALEAARPRAELRLEPLSQEAYRLRNYGTATASGIINAEPNSAVQRWPDGLTLKPGEAHTFVIAGDYEVVAPSQLYVTWDGHAETEVLIVP
ncbi:hypothetical protein [Streptomyces sp. NPDC008150]|uniref:hypothetical protein n=1 Tax=Streptomyces sp. NPDC008150 TaxID=3364816 RepID=UPI0036F04DEE